MANKNVARRLLALLLSAALVFFSTLPAPAAEESDEVGRTPPRLSFITGDVSFWRPGATDWAQARLNTALAPGDALYSGANGAIEVQIGGRAFVRAGAQTQIGLETQEPDYVQLKVTTGRAALDIRTLAPGHTIELDTPRAAFTVAQPGYYRVDVGDASTTFITRRAGRATVTPAGGLATEIGPNDQVVIEGTDAPRVATYNAPALDDWDRWNYERTDHMLAGGSRYLPGDIYGADTLDHYGNWSVDATYGPLWTPSYVSSTWAPYSTGQWLWDPSYGWTWVDDAPWGWAPFHYGRWVYGNRCWAWAPGPIVAGPVYAPALVAFFGGPGFRVGIGVPFVSWVALGWGEPLFPWWGHAGFVGRPWWGGWGGPRNHNVFVQNTTIVNVFQNSHAPHGMVAVQSDRFGRGRVESLPLAGRAIHQLQAMRGTLPFKPGPNSLVPESRGVANVARPSDNVRTRPVVTARGAEDRAMRGGAAGVAAATHVQPGSLSEASRSSRLSQPSLRGFSGTSPQRFTQSRGSDLSAADRPHAPQPFGLENAGRAMPRRFDPPPPPAQRSVQTQNRMDGANERSRPPSPPRFEGNQRAAGAVANVAPWQSHSFEGAREQRAPVPSRADAAPSFPAGSVSNAPPPARAQSDARGPRTQQYADQGRAPAPPHGGAFAPHAYRSAPMGSADSYHSSRDNGGVAPAPNFGGASATGRGGYGRGGRGR